LKYWLLKTEPGDYAIDDLERDGTTCWDGIGNNAALKNLRDMRPGDEAFIYHTGKDKSAVGIARVVSDPYQKDEKDVIDITFVRRLPTPVTLQQIKAEPSLAEWALVKQSRLSVVPVTKSQWEWVLMQADA
jgi:predicted RNA-binding protein with PUA-like domain